MTLFLLILINTLPCNFLILVNQYQVVILSDSHKVFFKSSKAFDKCFYNNKKQIVIIKLLNCEFLHKKFTKELILISQVLFIINELFYLSIYSSCLSNFYWKKIFKWKLIHIFHQNQYID